MKYSIIVPVFNRSDEVDELLDSLTKQTIKDFEVIIVEDGSQNPCKEVCEKYKGKLSLKYFMKENSGPGPSRNFGAGKASGEYLLILDSDVLLPEGYLEAIEEELKRESADAFGGPDRAHESFTAIQKAISISMTSFFTTGGIRGGKKKLDKFYPRSFNMGIRRTVYENLGGFSKMRFGEDIDFSIRIFKAGYKCRLFPGAWVWHKRRTSFNKFWRQVYNSGIARVNLFKKYPESLKLVHLLPAVFTIGTFALLILACIGFILAKTWLCLIPLILLMAYFLLIMCDSLHNRQNIKVSILTGIAAYIQLTGYGCGFINAWWKRCVRRMDEFTAYKKTFYK